MPRRSPIPVVIPSANWLQIQMISLERPPDLVITPNDPGRWSFERIRLSNAPPISDPRRDPVGELAADPDDLVGETARLGDHAERSGPVELRENQVVECPADHAEPALE